MLRPCTRDRSLPLFDSAELRRLEADAARRLPPHTLMARAGAAVARLVRARFPHARRVVVLAGPGNNGGDGLIAARELHRAGLDVVVAACGADSLAGWSARLPPDAAWAWSEALAAGVPADWLPAVVALPAGDLYIDALLGIGLSGPVRADAAALIDQINARSTIPVLGVDCPSGLDADRGTASPIAVRATVTLSLLGLKPGLCTGPDAGACGELWVDDLDAFDDDAAPVTAGRTLGADIVRAQLPDLAHAAHKGRRGDVRIVGGAPGMGGAALLAARSAAMLGAGRVFVGLLDPQAPTIDYGAPELMLRPVQALLAMPAAGVGRGALAFGPGAGTDSATCQWLAQTIDQPLPLVLDADGLNVVAQHAGLMTALARRDAPTVLTPHPLEAARLLHRAPGEIQADRLAAARELAQRCNAWVVLKGAGTVVAAPSGPMWINPTGNGLLATAGSGDVLTGAIAALIAATGRVEAALAAVWLHGAAADRHLAETGPAGLTASALAHWMAASWAEVADPAGRKRALPPLQPSAAGR